MELGAHSRSFATTTYTHCSIGFTPRLRSSSWIRAAAEGGRDPRRSLAADGPRVVEVAAAPVGTTTHGSFGGARDAELAMWDKLGAVVRLSYGIGKFILIYDEFTACSSTYIYLIEPEQGSTPPWPSPGDSYARWPE